MAFPTYGAATTAGAGNGGAAVSLAAPSGLAAGAYQLAIVAIVSSSPTFGAAPNGWTKILDVPLTDPDSSSTSRLGVFESTSDTGPFNITLSASRVWQGIRAYWNLPSGSAGRTVAVASMAESGTRGTAHPLPSVTTTAPDSLIIGIGLSETASAAQSWSSLGAATSRVTYDALNTIERLWLALGDVQRATPGSGTPATYTTSVADFATLATVVIDGASSAPLLPHQAMNIGQGAGKVHIAVDVAEAGASARVLHKPSAIEAGLNIVPEFTVPEGSWTQFSTRADAPTTSANTAYARCEARETVPGSDDNFGFNPADGGTHWMRVRERVVEAPAGAPHICTAQLHSLQDDTVMVRTRLVSGQIKLVLRVYDPGTSNSTDVLRLSENYTLGEIFDLCILVHRSYCYVFYQDFVAWIYRFPVSILPVTSTYFYKWGNYLQFNESTSGASATSWGTTQIRNANHWHTGWAPPANYFGCPEVGVGSAASVAVGQPLVRTATDSGVGIIERKWAILDGPVGAGTAIGTSAGLAWTPTATGSYVLAYGAKNAEGWSNPTFLDVTVHDAPVYPAGAFMPFFA